MASPVVPRGESQMLLLFPQEKHVNMLHIESRKSRRRSSEVEIFVDCECGQTEFSELVQLLKSQSTVVMPNPPASIWAEGEGKASCPRWGASASREGSGDPGAKALEPALCLPQN